MPKRLAMFMHGRLVVYVRLHAETASDAARLADQLYVACTEEPDVSA